MWSIERFGDSVLKKLIISIIDRKDQRILKKIPGIYSINRYPLYSKLIMKNEYEKDYINCINSDQVLVEKSI